MLNAIKEVFVIKSLRKKIVASVPGVDPWKLEVVMNNNSWLAFFSALMWWGMDRFSIILMWLSPYINAMIILQLMWVIVPKLGELQKEWEAGQKKITK